MSYHLGATLPSLAEVQAASSFKSLPDVIAASQAPAVATPTRVAMAVQEAASAQAAGFALKPTTDAALWGKPGPNLLSATGARSTLYSPPLEYLPASVAAVTSKPVVSGTGIVTAQVTAPKIPSLPLIPTSYTEGQKAPTTATDLRTEAAKQNTMVDTASSANKPGLVTGTNAKDTSETGAVTETQGVIEVAGGATSAKTEVEVTSGNGVVSTVDTQAVVNAAVGTASAKTGLSPLTIMGIGVAAWFLFLRR